MYPDFTIAADFVDERAGVSTIGFEMHCMEIQPFLCFQTWVEAIYDVLAVLRANGLMGIFTHLKLIFQV
jgi:hypothetical protein